MKKKKNEKVVTNFYPFIFLMSLNLSEKLRELGKFIGKQEGNNSRMKRKCHFGEIKKINIIQNESLI